MNQESIISWTPANWITVLLMTGLGFAILGAIARVIQQQKANAGS